MRIVDQLRQARHILRCRGDAQESRGLQTLPPARRGGVRADELGPPVVFERLRQLAPALPRHPRRPFDDRVDRQRHGEPGQSDKDARQWGRPCRPAPHGGVDGLTARIQPGAAPQPEPAVQYDENNERAEEDPLDDGDDSQEVAGGHRPTQRLIFSSATRRLIGFTM